MQPWQKWINYDSPYKAPDDELNRMRHYFYYVNNKGRLFRARIDKEDFLEGEIRDDRFKDRFFSQLRRNADFVDYLPSYSFLSINLYDHYFCRFAVSPVVFTDMNPEQEQLRFGATLLAPFTPGNMKYCESSGALFHPVTIPKTQESMMGVLASSIAESLVHSIEVDEKGNYSIDWKGRRLPIAHEESVDP
eukprot:jgi/Bigna1/131375/aug1.14_g6083